MDMRRALELSLLLVGIYSPANDFGVGVGFTASLFHALDEFKPEAVKEQEAVV